MDPDTDPDTDPDSLEMLDLDPDLMNPNQQYCLEVKYCKRSYKLYSFLNISRNRKKTKLLSFYKAFAKQNTPFSIYKLENITTLDVIWRSSFINLM
jgi:hypothetical protein